MLKTIASNIFEPAVRITKVSFIGNELTSLPDLGFRTAVELDLTNNTLSCDCGMTEFFAWVSEKGESTVTAECTAPEDFTSKGSCGRPPSGLSGHSLSESKSISKFTPDKDISELKPDEVCPETTTRTTTTTTTTTEKVVTTTIWTTTTTLYYFPLPPATRAPTEYYGKNHF